MASQAPYGLQPARLLAFAWLAAVVLALPGCFITAEQRIIAIDRATTPPQLQETYLSEKSDGYLRFLEVSPSRYAVEMLGTGEDGDMSVSPVRFFPLDDDVFVIETPSGERSYDYGLVRFSKGRFQLLNIDDVQPDQRTVAASQGVTLNGAGEIIGTPSLPVLNRFFRTLAERAPLAVSYDASDDLPAAAAHAAYERFFAHITLQPVEDALDAGNPDLNDFWLSYLRFLHDRGEPWASYSLARLYYAGTLVTQDHATAARYAETAVERGLTRANNLLAVYAQFGINRPADMDEALTLFRQAADAGEPWAMYNLARLYFEGESVAQDIPRGLERLQAAAAAGLPGAAYDLALRYLNADGLAQDDGLALTWFEKAADGSNRDAMAWLGWMFANGRGTEVNNERASTLFQEAAEHGQVWAQWQIGERLIAGTGVAADRTAGLDWLRKAADAGQEEAKAALAKHELSPNPKASTAGGSVNEEIAAIDEEIAGLDVKLADVNADLARIEAEVKELCGGRYCKELADGRYLYRTETYVPPRWYFEDGRLAPRDLWPD